MARRLIAGLAPGIELQGDYVVRLVAIDPSTGAAVAGVVVSDVTMQVDQASEAAEAFAVPTLPELLTYGPEAA